jgi:hypothetical protein
MGLLGNEISDDSRLLIGLDFRGETGSISHPRIRTIRAGQ